MRSRRFLGALGAALAGVLLLSGCRLTANVTVTMNADGSGVVSVDLVADADLLAKAPSAVSDLRLDDARQAGWEVTGPAPTADGGSSMRLAKPFHTAAEAEAVVAELNGPQGPLRDMRFARSVSFARVDITVSGTVQWDGGLAAFSDAALANVLGRPPLEQEVAASGVAAEDALAMTVTLKLPGKVSGNGRNADDGAVTWSPVLRAGGRTEIEAHSSVIDRGAQSARRTEHIARSALVVYVSVVVLGVLVASLIVLRRRSTVSPRRTPSR
ncbi:MAG: hypothetical protein QOD72_295 [Acidimicrobiaceae bacterium]|nr:hypothetical protein [Acidimicrobiaceae bacterium]